jgi:ankyrin repeat protein
MKFVQETGETPLHYACGNHHSDVARAFLELGADLHAKDKVRYMDRRTDPT